MRILLLSDTHSYIDDAIIAYAKEADEIWHAGDIGSMDVANTLAKEKPLIGVYGNIDDNEIRNNFKEVEIFDRLGISVFMTHIGGTPPRYTPKLKAELIKNKPKLFVCGHSHILRVLPDHKNGIIYMNPGAAGQQGFHSVRTMLRFEIKNSQIVNLAAIELGKRGAIK